MKTKYSFIIDFSFDGEKLTIFELGDFFTSSLDRLDKLRKEEGKAPLKEEYMAQLQSDNPDAIYLDIELCYSSLISFRDFSTKHCETYNFRRGGENTIEALLKCRGLLGQHQTLARPVIASFDFVPSVTTRATLAALTNDKFKLLNYPQGVLREAARDKTVFHAFTNDSSISPSTVLLDLRASDIRVNLNAFFEENKATHYVIKPTSLTQGMGVSIVTQTEAIQLIEQLQRALTDYSIPVGAWSTSFAQANYFALLQTCVPSKEMLFENKPYRPTGRAVITATFHDEDALPVLTCLGGYWELPKESVKEAFTTSSLVSPDGRYNKCVVLPIDPIDWCKINEEINQHLPSILSEMHRMPLVRLEEKFNFSPAMREYSKHLGITKLSLEKQSSLKPGLEREIASLFESLEYVSFNVRQKPGYFKKALTIYPGYVEEVKKKDLPIQSIIQSKPSRKGLEKIPTTDEPYSKRKNLIEHREHDDSILLLSRNKPQLVPFFFFCTGIVALVIGIETQRESLLAYGVFGMFAGAYGKYVSLQENETIHNAYSK